MGLALNVGCDVAVDIGARSSAQSWQITAEILETRRCPPESELMFVVTELLTLIKIVSLKQCFRTLELLVSVVILVVEVSNFLVHRLDRCSCFIGSCLRDQRDWSDVALRVVTQINARDEAGIDEISLKA